MRTLVIGGSGRVGRLVVRELSGHGVDVRALARRPEMVEWPPGVEAVRGDLTVPESLEPALKDVDAVFLVWVAPAAAVDGTLPRIADRVSRMVYLSAPLKTPHPLCQQPNPMRDMMAEIESRIEASGVDWTFLRPGMFAGNALHWWGPQMRASDIVRWPYPDVATAPVDERDIAAVAVRALCEDGHRGAEYVLTGPEGLTQSQQLETIGRAMGRPLRMELMAPEEARRMYGNAPWIGMLLNAWAASVGHEAFVTRTVEHLTGRPARSFEEWARDHAPHFARD